MTSYSDSSPAQPPAEEAASRFGTVAIVGRTNVGKSTFLNACLGEKLAIVSPLPQTTRDELLGVLNYQSEDHDESVQIAFTDTPGLHRPKTELGRRMNARALDTVRSHDLVVFMTDVSKLAEKFRRIQRGDSPDPLALVHADDRRLLQALPSDVAALLVLNKVDLLKDKGPLLPLIEAFQQEREFASIVPVSVLRDDGVSIVLDEIRALLPHRDLAYADDQMTDKPISFFVREYVREQVMLQTRSEVPHAVAVTLDRYEEGEQRASIAATIHIEKAGQKAILVGRGGAQIREIGTAARKQLEALTGQSIFLELFVRITPRWKDVPRQLKEMGYDGTDARDLKGLLPDVGINSGKKPRKKKRTPRQQPSSRTTKTSDSEKTSTKRRPAKTATARATAAKKTVGKKTTSKTSAGKTSAGKTNTKRRSKARPSKQRSKRSSNKAGRS